MDDLVLTPEGFAELKEELGRLRDVRRPEVAERLRQAVQLAGDLGDNLEYLDALREQEELEGRIALLEDRLAYARVLERGTASASRVSLGSWAELEDLDTGGHARYLLVSSAEGDPAHGRLSIESPVGRTIAGHGAGETVEVPTPRGKRHLRIVAAGVP